MSNKMKNMRAALLFFIVAVISLGVSAQNVTVKGTVRDVQATMIKDVTVAVKGSENFVTSDAKGEYKIKARVGDILIFSKKGYTTQKVQIGEQETINLTLLNQL